MVNGHDMRGEVQPVAMFYIENKDWNPTSLEELNMADLKLPVESV